MNTENNNEFGFTEEELREQQEARANRKSQPIRVSTILIRMTHYEEGVKMQIERSKDISHYEAIGIYETLCRQHVLHSINSMK